LYFANGLWHLKAGGAMRAMAPLGSSVWISGPEPKCFNKTFAGVASRHDDWAMNKLLPREVLFQAVNSVDQWLKSMLISKN
jgi:hypothetical protein